MNIQGVLYIETPNNITFNGNVNVQGVIVTQNNPLGNLSTNILNFSGNVTATPVNTLPEALDMKSRRAAQEGVLFARLGA